MRRLISILLLVAFGLPAVPPLLAMTAAPDMRLPACCRRSGRHHCAGGMDAPAESHGKPQLRAQQADCPYAPRLLNNAHREPHSLPLTRTAVPAAPPVASPAIQNVPPRTAARNRARPQRGPPSLLSVL